MKTMLKMMAITALVAVTQTLSNAQEVGENLYVKVSENREISGKPVELDEIMVTTGFGDVAIPLMKVDGIKMNAGADGSAVIAFRNGDLVTGKVMLDQIKLKTVWGQANINTSRIEMISFSENGRFYTDTTGGKSLWRFAKSPPDPNEQLLNAGTVSR